jgi:hypothetical protein
MKSCQQRAFWAQREPIIGILGHGQQEVQFSNADPTTACMYSKLFSRLKVMVKLTRAAIGNGNIAGETSARRQLNEHTI